MLNDGLILSALMALFGAARILCERWDAKAARRADILTVRRIRHDFYLGMFFCSLALLAALSWPGIKSDAVLIALLITFVAWFFALSVNPDLLVRSGSIVRRYTPEKSSPVGNVDPSGRWTASGVIQWVNDTYRQVVPGGEFVDATGVVPGAVKAWLKTQAENRAIHDMGRSLKCNFMNDPIYNALMNMAQGQPLSPAEHAAIQQRLSRGEPRDFWSWFWSIL